MLQRIANGFRKRQTSIAVYYTEQDGTRELDIFGSTDAAQKFADKCTSDGCSSVTIKPLRWPWSVKFARWQQRRAIARNDFPYPEGGSPLVQDLRELCAGNIDAVAFAESMDQASQELRKIEGPFDVTTASRRIDELSTQHRTVLDLHFAGLKYQAIAVQLDISDRSALTLLSQAMSYVREGARDTTKPGN